MRLLQIKFGYRFSSNPSFSFPSLLPEHSGKSFQKPAFPWGEVLPGYLGIYHQQVNRYANSPMGIHHSGTTTFAPPRGCNQKFTNATGSRDLITCQWISGQTVYQFLMGFLAQNPINPSEENSVFQQLYIQ